MPTSVVYERIKALITAIAFVAIASVGFTSTAAYADDLKDWRVKVVKKIAKKHIYPRSAISREIEGKARVQITIARSGEITNFEILEPSGKRILDAAIPKMIKKLTPLPSPPDSLKDANLTFVIPITWRLQ